MCGSGSAGRGAPVRGVRQAALHAAHAQAAHGAAAPAAAALGALRALPQGLPHSQLPQQPQEHLPPAPTRAAANRRPRRPRRATRRQDGGPASRHRLLQVQRPLQCLNGPRLRGISHFNIYTVSITSRNLILKIYTRMIIFNL